MSDLREFHLLAFGDRSHSDTPVPDSPREVQELFGEPKDSLAQINDGSPKFHEVRAGLCCRFRAPSHFGGLQNNAQLHQVHCIGISSTDDPRRFFPGNGHYRFLSHEVNVAQSSLEQQREAS